MSNKTVNEKDEKLIEESKDGLEDEKKLISHEEIDDSNLTEKSIEQIKVLEEKLSEINLEDNVPDINNTDIEKSKKIEEYPKPDNLINDDSQKILSTNDVDDLGEITFELSSSTDEELKNKIAQIKSELNANLTFKDKLKQLFKPKAQKKIEKKMIENKAIELSGNKRNVKYVQTNFRSTIGLFSVFYSRNDMAWRIMIACLVGIIIGLVTFLFVQNTGVVVTGMSGIFQGIARISKVLLTKFQDSLHLNEAHISVIYSALFYGSYLLANVPLIIFSYKKIGKNFTIISTIPVLLSNIIPLLLNLIPNADKLFVFGDTISKVTSIENGIITETGTELNKYGVNILTFINGQFNGELILDAPKFISMFLYTMMAGIFNGMAISMIMAVGGSAGGLDFISFYFSYKKNKPLGTILLSFNISSVIITTMLGSYISAIIVNPEVYYRYEFFFSQNLLTGFIYAVILSLMIGNLFPKDKVVKISIYSSQVLKIRNYLYSKNFNHSLTINTTTGGYSMSKQQNIEIICMFIEIPKILHQLRTCDAQGLITITRVKGIDGKLMIESNIN